MTQSSREWLAGRFGGERQRQQRHNLSAEIGAGAAGKEEPVALLLPALSDAACLVASLVSPRTIGALDIASRAICDVLSPASAQIVRKGRLVRHLKKYPFVFDFALNSLNERQLDAALGILAGLRLLRRREHAGHGAGLVPTELDPWHVQSAADLTNIVTSARTVLQQARRLASGRALLLGSTMRAETISLASLTTAPVGFEWVDGPAADPLQLGITLRCGEMETAEVVADDTSPGAGRNGSAGVQLDLEMTSGGWSEWAETWSLADGSLDLAVVVAVLTQAGTIFVEKPLGAAAFRPIAGLSSEASMSALHSAFVNAGEHGLHVLVGIGTLSWRGSAPAWCPAEISQLLPTP
eukprot:TRINITY_DN30281_c0_g1_i2.p1 TRINITY_DN30281_c0_g1~~TRINITY_DN30281_c0_g1_i2.p1  ORF type:complete len:365 (+),score=74.58 TRINITY_DN30281_c0_g1_i2:38-1096(+)